KSEIFVSFISDVQRSFPATGQGKAPSILKRGNSIVTNVSTSEELNNTTSRVMEATFLAESVSIAKMTSQSCPILKEDTNQAIKDCKEVRRAWKNTRHPESQKQDEAAKRKNSKSFKIPTDKDTRIELVSPESREAFGDWPGGLRTKALLKPL
ncbi:hypothetical protein GcC1_202018, partial [Golovinomyces cichoracearum]